ncbi:MAG: DedA family protein [Bacteroidota bacterium]|nr:DedA family protein [Bacteroidota bacterium]
MEVIVNAVASLDLRYVYFAVFLFAFAENLFPPLPSDVIVAFGGALVTLGDGSASLTVALATAGSLLGFLSMYGIGRRFGGRILKEGRIPFITASRVDKVRKWFGRYGYGVIVLNRFLAGTRAVVAFGAGVSALRPAPTLVLSLLSAAMWNSLLVAAGIFLGENWREIERWLSAYSAAVGIALAVFAIIAILAARAARKRKSQGGGKA